MSAIELASPTQSRRASSRLTRATSAAHWAWRRYWDRRAKKATVKLLRGLDARTLKDIGLSPGEIESAVYGRPSDRLVRYE